MLIRSFVGTVIGILGGAGAGALTLGWDASMAVGSSFIGATRDWWPVVVAMAGAIGGAVFGLALGLYISLTGIGMLRSAIAGGVVGVIGIVVMLPSGDHATFWWLRSVPSRAAPLLLSLIIWGLLGLLISAAASKLSKAEPGSPPPRAAA